jgi:hypothetical protein
MEAEKIDIAFVDTGMVHGPFAQSLAATARDLEYFGAMGEIIRASTSLLNVARNSVVHKFLQESDSPWLFCVDSDIVLDKGHVQRLWLTANEHDVKMVSGLYFALRDTHRPTPQVLMIQDGQSVMPAQVPLDQPFVAFAAGLGSCLIHREVFEAITDGRTETLRWFDQMPIPYNDEIAGEDVYFFYRANEAGYTLLVDPLAKTDHIKSYPLNEGAYITFWENVNAKR